MKKKSVYFLIFFCLSIHVNGQFGPKNSINKSIGYEPEKAHFGDMNNDGILDIITFSKNGSVYWLQNDGDANFTSQTLITNAAHDCTDARPTDIDNDGDLDILTGHCSSNELVWYENIGNGSSFVEHIIIETINSVILTFPADLDEDGDDDILFDLNSEDNLYWIENLGDGNFGELNIIESGQSNIYSFDFVDLNGDGLRDILISAGQNSAVAWFENLGGGEFTDKTELSSSSSGQPVLALGEDIDGDLDLDIIYSNLVFEDLVWYENDGVGNFGESDFINSNSGNAYQFVFEDIDTDGDPDLFIASHEYNKIIWLENLGNGTFSSANSILINIQEPKIIGLADLNYDGYLDIVTSIDNVVGDHLILLKGEESNMFSSPEFLAPYDSNYDLVPIDFDNDSDIDFVSLSFGTIQEAGDYRMNFFENMGDNSFGSPEVWEIEVARDLSTLDANNDNNEDLLVSTEHNICLYLNATDSIFSSEISIPLSSNQIKGVTAGKINNDDFDDFVAYFDSDNTLKWFSNNLDSTFTEHNIDTLSDFSTYILHSGYLQLADLNNDGTLDLVAGFIVGDTSYQPIYYYLNDGFGNFSEKIPLKDEDSGFTNFEIGDFDGDSDLDVLYYSWWDNIIAWVENNGDDSFGQEHLVEHAYSYPRHLMTEDVNGDGFLDLTISHSNSGVVLMYNNGLGDFIYNDTPLFMSETIKGFYYDLNQDSKPDLIGSYDGQITWRENIFFGGCLDPLACNYDPDMEFNLPLLCEYFECIECIGDATLDGVVNELDMQVVMDNLGCIGECPGDVDGNGLVNINDLVLVNIWFEIGCED